MALYLDAGLVEHPKIVQSLVEELQKEFAEEVEVAGAERAINFDEFVDLMTLPPAQARSWWQAKKRSTRRLFSNLGVDVYGTKNVQVQDWDWQQQPQTGKSVYAQRLKAGIRRSLSKKGTDSPDSP